MADRKCLTCKHFEPSPIRRRGWCRNSLLYAPQQSHLVHQDDLDCGHRLGNYWEPAEPGDGQAPDLTGDEAKPEAAALQIYTTKPHQAPAADDLIARSSSSGGGNPLGSGGGSTGGGSRGGGGFPPSSGRQNPGVPGGSRGPERSVSYQPEERYWTDYLRIAFPVIGLLLLLGLFWFWATELIGGDNNNTPTPVAGQVGAPTATATTGTGGVLTPQTPTTDPNVVPTQTVDSGIKPTRTPRSSTDETPTTAEQKAAFSEGDTVVTTESINLRSEPAIDVANIITLLDSGVTLTVNGATQTVDGADWVPVLTQDGEEGYVSAEFLELSA